MNLSKIVYSEKLGENFKIDLHESEDIVRVDSSENYKTIRASVIQCPKSTTYGIMLFQKEYRLENNENKYVKTLNYVINDYENKVQIDAAANAKFNKIEKLEEKKEFFPEGVKVYTLPWDSKAGTDITTTINYIYQNSILPYKIVSDKPSEEKNESPIVLNITINNNINKENAENTIKAIVEGLKRLGVNIKQ